MLLSHSAEDLRVQCLDRCEDRSARLSRILVSVAYGLNPHSVFIRVSRPDLVPRLADAITSSLEARDNNSNPNASLLLRRSLEVLNAVLKEYAAFKMLTGVKTMGQVRDALCQSVASC